jgi:thiosulfate dehydrogenase
MKYLGKIISAIFIISLWNAVAFLSSVQAQSEPPSGEDIVRGAQLYDRWYAVLGVAPQTGDMPIWARQSTNTRSGPETWRCAECHGWDYRGASGAYGDGSHYTGFPDVMNLSGKMSIEEIVAHLNGEIDPAHDFSPYMDEKALSQLAVFLKSGTIDDTEYINPISLQVIDGDIDHGKQLYESTCAACHGAEGKKIIFRTEGVDEYLGSVANRDPWRFLHRTRFGVAGTSMPIGFNLGWTPEDGRDILAYAQFLPAGGALIVSEPAAPLPETPTKVLGGPATNLLTGILTGFGAFFGAVGFTTLFIGGFALIGIIVVTFLRRRK